MPWKAKSRESVSSRRLENDPMGGEIAGTYKFGIAVDIAHKNWCHFCHAIRSRTWRSRICVSLFQNGFLARIYKASVKSDVL